MRRIGVRLAAFALAGIALGQTAQPTLPTEPGMYVVVPTGGLVKIIGQIAEFKRSGSTLVSHATAGIKSVKVNIQLLGPHAQTLVSSTPVFYFVPAKQEADAGVNAGDLILVRLEEKPERRQFEIAAHGLGRASSGISLTHQVQLLRSETSNGIYKVTTAIGLTTGEYALYLSRGEGMAPYVYDFSVQQTGAAARPKQATANNHEGSSANETIVQPMSAADFSSTPRVDSPPPQIFKGASIGVFCDGNPDVRHDGVTLTALTPGGPAEQAGIKPGDVLLAINDHYLFTIRDLHEQISHHQPGTRITVRYRRYSSINETQMIVGQVE